MCYRKITVPTPPSSTETTISDFTQTESDSFIATEWPPHDAALGIRWTSNDVVLKCQIDERVVGAARGVVAGGVGELKQLLVTKDRVHAGIGSKLLAEFEARCRSLGCHKVRLETADYQARPFYERHGFVVAATLTNDRFGRTWFVMEKRLLP